MAKKKVDTAVEKAREIRNLAAVENIAVPDGMADADVKSYVLGEMDRRLNENRAKSQKVADSVMAVDEIPLDDDIAEALLHPAEKAVDDVMALDIEVVRKALERHVAAGMSFTVDADGVWTMKRGIKEDCGNLSMPLRMIVRCADGVCARTLVPKLDKDGSSQILMA